MEYNIFIVAGPLHLMNSIEAVHEFKTENNILLILYTDNKRQLEQMEKLIGFINWHTIKYLPLPQKNIDKILFVKNIHNRLKDIEKDKINKIFVGEYRSDHVNHIVNYFQNINIYLVDDGLAQVSYHKEMSQQSLKVKIRRLVYKAIFYKLSRIKYIFYTIYDIENEHIIKNSYSFFKAQISNKKVKKSIYFIGQPLVELGMVSDDTYKNEIKKIIHFYGDKKFIYILHRRENIENIKKISSQLNFEYKEFNNLIELEMINSKKIPSDFATFFSTAIVTLPHFIKESRYQSFKIQDRYIEKKFLSGISDTYLEFKKIGLRVEEL